MPDPSSKGDPSRAIRVRYYPRRVEHAAAPTVLTPGQALHLAHDPERAERARRTAEARDLPTPPAGRAGIVRRLINRLRSR